MWSINMLSHTTKGNRKEQKLQFRSRKLLCICHVVVNYWQLKLFTILNTQTISTILFLTPDSNNIIVMKYK
jgi:hypothetical protein